MKTAELKAYRIEQFDFVNKAPQGIKMQLENKITYNVGYSNNDTCRGELRAEISDRSAPDKFRIVITISGIFATAQGTEKERIHLDSFDMLFPYAKAAISMFTAQAGIPPVYLPYTDISKQNIYRVEMPSNHRGSEDEKE